MGEGQHQGERFYINGEEGEGEGGGGVSTNYAALLAVKTKSTTK